MSWLRALLGVVVAGSLVGPGAAVGQSARYVLTAESRIETYCHTCTPVSRRSEALSGTFELGTLPSAEYSVEALTGIRWTGGKIGVTGSGFLQRFADGRLAMVIDARFNGVPILLTSGRRQASPPGEIRLQLTSPKGARSGFTLTIVAVPDVAATPDADGDGVQDAADNCPRAASADQADADADSVGDACDACPDTAAGEAVLRDGCALAQTCPCAGPSADEEWPTQRAYVQCVARTLKTMRIGGQLDRNEIRLLLQDAVRSGCGRRVLAMG